MTKTICVETRSLSGALVPVDAPVKYSRGGLSLIPIPAVVDKDTSEFSDAGYGYAIVLNDGGVVLKTKTVARGKTVMKELLEILDDWETVTLSNYQSTVDYNTRQKITAYRKKVVDGKQVWYT